MVYTVTYAVTVAAAALDVAGTSRLLGAVGPSSLVGAIGATTGAAVGVSTISSIGTDVGEVVVSFKSTVSFGEFTVGLATGARTMVGTGCCKGDAAGTAFESHWKVSQDLLSVARQRSHGSTTLRHCRQDKQSILTASHTIPSKFSHVAPESIVSPKHCRQSDPIQEVAKARSSTHASGVAEKSFRGSQ